MVFRGEGVLWNRRYVVRRTQWPLALLKVRPQTEGGSEFTTIKGVVERTQRPNAVKASWISQATWQLLYWRTAFQRAGRASTREVRKARRNFQRMLQADRHQRVQAAGANVEELLEAGRFKESRYHLAQCCFQVRGKQSHFTREGLERVSTDRVELCRCRPPEGLHVPLLVHLLAVNDYIPA